MLARCLDLVRSLGRTCAEKRSILGQGLPPVAVPVGGEPLTAQDISDNMALWRRKIKNLEHRIYKLPEDTPAEEQSYMKGRLAKYIGLHLAAQAIFQTCERVGTVHKLVPCPSCVCAVMFSTLSTGCLSVNSGYLFTLSFFPKATAKGSFEKSTTIKDCRSDRCL